MIKELLDSEYKYEVTLQKNMFLDKEKNAFADKFRDKLHSVEQRSGLRVLILLTLESYIGEETRMH